MFSHYKDKKVLFVTTKNQDYIRNMQEIRLLSKYAEEVTVVASMSKSYPKRLLHVYRKLLTINLKTYDAVFVGFAPQLVLPLFGRRLGKKELTIDFFISMYDTLCLDRKKIKPGSFFGKLLHRIDQKTLEKADRIICDTNAHGKFFIKEFQAAPEKMHTLYLEAASEIYRPSVAANAVSQKQKDSFEVLYFGSVLPLQGVDTVLQAYGLLADKPNLHLTFIGPVDEKKLSSPKPVSDNIEYINWLSQKELAKRISKADLCLAGHFHPTIEKAKRTIPGKAFIYSAMEKAMILGDNPANHEYFTESEKISFVPMGDAKALADSILKYQLERDSGQVPVPLIHSPVGLGSIPLSTNACGQP